jgi:hypothetical protein
LELPHPEHTKPEADFDDAEGFSLTTALFGIGLSTMSRVFEVKFTSNPYLRLLFGETCSIKLSQPRNSKTIDRSQLDLGTIYQSRQNDAPINWQCGQSRCQDLDGPQAQHLGIGGQSLVLIDPRFLPQMDPLNQSGLPPVQ